MEGFRILMSMFISSSGGNRLSERWHEHRVWHEDGAQSLVVNNKTVI